MHYRVEIDHQVDRPEQVRGLRDDEAHRLAEIRRILWVDVTQLHLEVARPLVPHVREVRLGVVKEQRILRTLVKLELRHRTLFCLRLELNHFRMEGEWLSPALV